MKLLFTLLFFTILIQKVNAQNIVQFLRAEVISIDDYTNKLNNQLQLGDTIEGTLFYSHNVFDSEPDTTVGDYWFTYAPFGIALAGPGNLLFSSDGSDVSFLCEAVNLPSVAGGDGIMFRSYNNFFSPGNDAADKVITWQVDDADGVNLTSDTLPIISDLSIWDQLYGLTINADDFPDGTPGYFIRATVVEIVNEEGTGIDSRGLETEVKVFPNPANSFFEITNAPDDATLIIEDVNGKVMLEQNFVPSKIDITDFFPGLYVVKITDEKSTRIFKVLKIR